MKIVTWNVNSIRSRLTLILQWLRDHQPAVVLLQETKCVNSDFPKDVFEDLGYNVACHGEKSYNGVAILSYFPIEDVRTTLPGDPTDTQARYLEGWVGSVRVASVYVPNGQEVGSPKYAYKLRFMERLWDHIQLLLTYEEALVIGGDYNIAPYAVDMHDPAYSGTDRILCSQREQDHLRLLLNGGLTDAVRVFYPSSDPHHTTLFTWWDYRQRAFEQNKGYRLDHLLLSPQAADLLKAAGVDQEVRAFPKASDHAPTWIEIEDKKKT